MRAARYNRVQPKKTALAPLQPLLRSVPKANEWSGIMMRNADGKEVAMIVDWAAREGWNPGFDDAHAFFTTDPAGFFLAERDGQPVAAISVVNHSDRFAFLGLYICRPEWRGQGIGLALWQHALRHAGGRTVGLDGVAAQQANYARSGFAMAGATRRFEGRLPPRPHSQIRPVTQSDSAALLRLDCAATGVDRPGFVAAWTTDTSTRRTLTIDRGFGPEGYATIRACRTGAKIGPIIAPDAALALALAEAAVAALPADPVIIDVPDSNTALSARLADRGFLPTFATARMYRGPAPTAGIMAQAIATMELG